MLTEKEAEAIKKFCSTDSDGMLFAFGLVREDGFYQASLKGQIVIPFWSNRSELERILSKNSDMAECEIVELDVVFLVSNQFHEFESQGSLVGMNWRADQNEWWGRPVAEVEDAIRTEIRWPK